MSAVTEFSWAVMVTNVFSWAWGPGLRSLDNPSPPFEGVQNFLGRVIGETVYTCTQYIRYGGAFYPTIFGTGVHFILRYLVRGCILSEDIWYGGAFYPRIFAAGMLNYRGVRFPVTLVRTCGRQYIGR